MVIFANRTFYIVSCTFAILLGSSYLVKPNIARAEELARTGCPMAHCNPQMTDEHEIAPPLALAREWSDSSVTGSNYGLGCSSNSRIAVCSFWQSQPALKAYDAQGSVLWNSGKLLNGDAWKSAPMILEDGSIIAADSVRLVRFAADGSVRWSSALAGGAPISPVAVGDRHILVAGRDGLIELFDIAEGRYISSLELKDSVSGRTFGTRNTPAVNLAGTRAYLLTEDNTEDSQEGRLYAVDIARDGSLAITWSFTFRARSGASPLVIGDRIIFDSDGPEPNSPVKPTLFAIRDLGNAPFLSWTRSLPAPMAASAARDPRGGIWIYTVRRPLLERVNTFSGGTLERVDLSSFSEIEPGAAPGSALTIVKDVTGPYAIFSLMHPGGLSSLAMIQLPTKRLVWNYPIGYGTGARALGQFPVIEKSGRSVVVFSTFGTGVRGVGGFQR